MLILNEFCGLILQLHTPGVQEMLDEDFLEQMYLDDDFAHSHLCDFTHYGESATSGSFEVIKPQESLNQYFSKLHKNQKKKGATRNKQYQIIQFFKREDLNNTLSFLGYKGYLENKPSDYSVIKYQDMKRVRFTYLETFSRWDYLTSLGEAKQEVKRWFEIYTFGTMPEVMIVIGSKTFTSSKVQKMLNRELHSRFKRPGMFNRSYLTGSEVYTFQLFHDFWLTASKKKLIFNLSQNNLSLRQILSHIQVFFDSLNTDKSADFQEQIWLLNDKKSIQDTLRVYSLFNVDVLGFDEGCKLRLQEAFDESYLAIMDHNKMLLSELEP
ncbi:hypothetical protein WICPIJ_004000 [Wickerhamomyces pijperi]|uniref:Uncharacterized protein n=1 Tax=Wickerhamomyces pijperi TaxID=599730 RepID=A0A9P8Q6F2_WICPI|nr:hypothetical protein WICPIJ_004000 [Wickerhamomyces pijperi]